MTTKIGDLLTITNAIVCEDVRAELNNKWSILGAYSGDIAVPNVPAAIKIAFYMEGQLAKPYHGPLSARIRLDNDQVALVTGTMDAKESGPVSLPIPGPIVPFQNAGTIFMDLSFDSSTWVEVVSKKLIIRSSGPTA
jgi:hypothetical protein